MKLDTRSMVLVALFAGLMVIGAFIKIPLAPPLVPITFQPFICAFAGILLGSKKGMYAMIIYAVLGLAGLPVFAAGGGILYVLKPTFGFILGFIPAAYIIGYISERSKMINIKNSLISLICGLLIMYMVGTPYFYLIMNFYLKSTTITPLGSLNIFYPYLIKDFILFIVIAYVSVKIVPIVRKNVSKA